MINSNLKELQKVIKWVEEYPKDIRTPVKSKRSEVTNLSSSIPIPINRVKEKILINFLQVLQIEENNVKKIYNNDFTKI